MENLELYEKVRSVPDEAKKTIPAGRLKNMTDINPMWRIKTLTEQFGVCGFGWYTEIVRTWELPTDEEVIVGVEIRLFVKMGDEWSKPIIGIGGSKSLAQEKQGVYVDDEAYKKAYTDALSVACKALGIGADVYFEKDRDSKYYKNDYDAGNAQKPPVKAKSKSKYTIIVETIKDSEIGLASVNNWISKVYGKSIPINDLSDEQFTKLLTALRKELDK